MRKFRISEPDKAIEQAVQDKIDNLTKPKGSLGRLEEIAKQIAMIQQTLSPELRNPQNILFAADHGIEREGVSATPRSVTAEQVFHFLKGKGAGITTFCNQNGFKLKVVDSGVDYDFPPECGVIDMKIAKGTNDFLYGPAMDKDQFDLCIERGAEVVRKSSEEGCNIISFGEMGAGNTSPSSIWMYFFTDIPLAKCIGAGSGLDDTGVERKREILSSAVANYGGDNSPEEIMRWFGGFEMVMAAGGMLQAAELGMVIIVDGFIMTSCILAACRIYPDILKYAIFGHQGDETGHKLMLRSLNAKPLLNLGLRLGEGTGAVCAYPVILSAINMLNNMDSFNHASITKYF